MKGPIVDKLPLEIVKPPKSKIKIKPDNLFNAIIFKMMAALAFSVALLFGGGTLLVYALNPNAVTFIGFDEEIISVWTFLGVHMTLLMFYYAFALFKYIVSD
ncbi:MAG: hypothetical protein KGD64_03260 [Candidatus Heimdallarchaeota archaeon]|nr:hypothetical protein [Candidatus Heimdallarchaeota archaeon]